MSFFVGAFLVAATACAQQLPDTLGTAEYHERYTPDATVVPADSAQTARPKLPVLSFGGASWTQTRYTVEGLDATDPYQTGRPLTIPDPFGVRDGAGPAFTFRKTESKWHGGASMALTGSSLSADNVTAPRGFVQRSEGFSHFLEPNFMIGGPARRWLDFFFSGTGRWSEQNAPLDTTSRKIGSYALQSTARVTLRPTMKDTLDVLILGGRANDDGWSLPYGIEAIAARRMAPEIRPQRDLRQEDHLDFVQIGWSRMAWGGDLHARYGYSTAHQDTFSRRDSLPLLFADIIAAHKEVAYVDLRTGLTQAGSGPLAQTQTVTPRHALSLTWRHPNGVWIEANYDATRSLHRFLNPAHSNAFLLDGQRVSGVIFDTAQLPEAHIRRVAFSFGDKIRFAPHWSTDLAVTLSHAHGDAKAGTQAISWSNAAPRAALTFNAVTAGTSVSVGYERTYAPIAGHYLDYGTPEGLSGREYVWNLANDDNGRFPYDVAPQFLLRRFGGRYTSIDRSLHQPYTDELFLSAEVGSKTWHLDARYSYGVDRRRLAAVNTGVPAAAYTPVTITDPGADYLTGTTDDRQLVVYSQNAATFGQDFFNLTNPSGLEMRRKAFVMDGNVKLARFSVNGSLYFDRASGVTNPGNQYWEADPGVVGSLYADPNTLINARGRTAMDRGFLAKTWLTYRMWRDVEIMTSVSYVGGTPYARQLIVTGLPQGPTIVNATPRGEDGGYRTPNLTQWDLRVAKSFTLPVGRLRAAIDIFNLPNRDTAIEVDEMSGPNFSKHLPWSVQAPRSARFSVGWSF